MRLIRGTVTVEVIYIFGDASGSGFGASWIDEDVIGFRLGVCIEKENHTRSNYQ